MITMNIKKYILLKLMIMWKCWWTDYDNSKNENNNDSYLSYSNDNSNTNKHNIDKGKNTTFMA